MEKKLCGECKLEINDLEPVRCGFCEACYHINQKCCGFNSRICKELFALGKILFICPQCRDKLNGRSINTYVADALNSQNAQSLQLVDLPSQVQKLCEMVDGLSNKVESMSQKPPHCDGFVGTPANLSAAANLSTPIWPARNPKRRRADRMPLEITSDRGTNTVDLSDLSVSSVASVVAKKCFWLYLSGLNPKVTDNDVQKIVSRCLNSIEPVAVVWLVRKGIDTTNYSYISYKIGLDPDVKSIALDPASWPSGLLFREFVDRPKN